MLIEIIRYDNSYENEVMQLISQEGDDWQIYWGESNAGKYRKSLETSVTYLAMSGGTLCGYIRALPDALFIYVCDLLVDCKYRGNGIGEKLLHRLQDDYSDFPIYIMSGSDGYYEKIGCKKEGSIYLLK